MLLAGIRLASCRLSCNRLSTCGQAVRRAQAPAARLAVVAPWQASAGQASFGLAASPATAPAPTPPASPGAQPSLAGAATGWRNAVGAGRRACLVPAAPTRLVSREGRVLLAEPGAAGEETAVMASQVERDMPI